MVDLVENTGSQGTTPALKNTACSVDHDFELSHGRLVCKRCGEIVYEDEWWKKSLEAIKH